MVNHAENRVSKCSTIIIADIAVNNGELADDQCCWLVVNLMISWMCRVDMRPRPRLGLRVILFFGILTICQLVGIRK